MFHSCQSKTTDGKSQYAQSDENLGSREYDIPVAMARLPDAKDSTSKLWKSAPGHGGMLHMPEIPG